MTADPQLFELPQQEPDEGPMPTRQELAQAAVEQMAKAVAPEVWERFSTPDQVRAIHYLTLTLHQLRKMYAGGRS